ncbi:sel1 repeat family protein [Helicobacter sp. 11S03491-1]|uniref:tetratricopeptide repeat protein n=1 Tax=Helicobacter sp. 11S03491-1 TaxID=1476196 RepID=UPI000BA76CA2|nr:sel1 repeat family protein [Helicobacter sp. 11S03491-1]PAF42956.1 hypothetical protein BKH45_02490 [Helicobacter sp. 11S03491-1]
MKKIFCVLVVGVFILKADISQTWDQECKQGNLASCVNLGYLYQSAQGVPKDLAQAKSLYKKACDNGYTPACEAYKVLEIQNQ